MISGSDQRQLLTDGAPPTGSVGGPQPGLAGTAGATAWWSRATFSGYGQTLMIARGADDVVELVDMTGATAPVKSSIICNSRGVWVQADGSFYTIGALSKHIGMVVLAGQPRMPRPRRSARRPPTSTTTARCSSTS